MAVPSSASPVKVALPAHPSASLNPECNAPLTAFTVRLQRFAGPPPSTSHSQPQVAEAQQSARLVHAMSFERRSRELHKLEQFRRKTKQRVARQVSAKREDEDARRNAVRRNFDRYLEQTRKYMAKFQLHQIREMDRCQKTPLKREEDRILECARAARNRMLAFRAPEQQHVQSPLENDTSCMHPSEPAILARKSSTKAAFWDRDLGTSQHLTRSEEVRLSLRLKKWEMHEERQRARTEAMLRSSKAAQAGGRDGTDPGDDTKNHDVQGQGCKVPGEETDEFVERYEEDLARVPARERVRQYAQQVRLRNRRAPRRRGTNRSDMDTIRRRLLEKVRSKGIEVPPLCNCGLTIFDETESSKCANNCSYYKNPKAFHDTIAAIFHSL